MTFEDIIHYENEGTSLDFKQKQYDTSNCVNLLKDIMAMANADVVGDRFLIIGVDYKASGDRAIIGIAESKFVDDAVYQQVVRENIEPDINFSYKPVPFDGKLIGVFRIGPCLNQPYAMRKDLTPLRRGEGYIRKGSHQTLLTRSDYDRIYQSRHNRDLGKNVVIGFGTELSQHITIPDKTIEFPSFKAASEIKAILQMRAANPMLSTISLTGTIGLSIFDSIPYSQRTTTELNKNLKNLTETYKEDDEYELQETAIKFNVEIINREDKYLHNATFILEIPEFCGFIFRKLRPEPSRNRFANISRITSSHSESSRYPSVEKKAGGWIIKQHVGDIINYHQQKLLNVPVRLAVSADASGQTISVAFRLHSENLSKPIEGNLAITFGKIELLRIPNADDNKK